MMMYFKAVDVVKTILLTCHHLDITKGITCCKSLFTRNFLLVLNTQEPTTDMMMMMQPIPVGEAEVAPLQPVTERQNEQQRKKQLELLQRQALTLRRQKWFVQPRSGGDGVGETRDEC
jgi:hypothetical protein